MVKVNLQILCCMADFTIITIPRITNTTLAHNGNRNTDSFGMNRRSVSPREYSPPIPAVVNIIPTDNNPRLECFRSTTAPNFLLIKTPKAIPAEHMDRSNLLASRGSEIPSLGIEFIPEIIANGVATKPPIMAQWATLSLDLGPFWIRHKRKAIPESANIPTVNSVAITWNVLAEIIVDHLRLMN